MKQKGIQYIGYTLAIGSILLPLFAFAQGTFGPQDQFGQTVKDFTEYALLAINFLLVLATLVFLWGIIKYVSAGGDATKIKEARSYILWGIVGLAIMGGVWGLVRFLQKSVGGTETGVQEIPKINLGR